MTIPVHDPLRLYVGDTWTLPPFACLDDDGNPLDLTGATIQWQLSTFDDNTAVASASLGAGITVTSPATGGVCVVEIDPATTAAIAPGYYRDQLRVTAVDGGVSTESSGRVEAVASLYVAPIPQEGEP